MWRRKDTQEIYDLEAAAVAARDAKRVRNAQHRQASSMQHNTYAERQQRAHNGKHMRARCNELLFQPGFDYSTVEYNDTSDRCTTPSAISRVCKHCVVRSGRPRACVNTVVRSLPCVNECAL